MKKLTRYIFALPLIPLLIACGEALPVSSGGVVDNSPIDLEWGVNYEGQLQGDQPFNMSVPNGAILNFTVESTAGVVTYRLLSQNSQLVGDNVRVGSVSNFSVVLNDTSGGDYQFLVRGFDAAYRVNVQFSLQNDGDSGGDASGILEEGVVLAADLPYMGLLGVNDSKDAYRYDVPAHSLMRLTITNPSTSERGVTIRGFAFGDEIFTPDPAAPGDLQTWVSSLGEDTTYGFTAAGTGAAYEFFLEITPANDGGSGGDAGESLTEAQPVTLGEPFTGHLSLDDTDCFSFAVPEAGQFEIITRNLDDPNERNRGAINIFLREAESRKLIKSQLVQFNETITSVERFSAVDHFICVVNDSPLAMYEILIQPFVQQ